MREHLYRGKRVDNGVWVEGYFYANKKGKFFIHIPVVEHCFYVYEVIPETVGEWTGLTDKNGKKIFEGDIIKTKFYGKDSGYGQNFADDDYFKVLYYEASFCIENASRRFVINAESTKRFEVIGNIHDNPELLEER